MSHVSPYQRSTAERGQHRKATAVFVVVAAAVLLVATAISGKPDPPPPIPDDESKKHAVDWTARIADVKRSLPHPDTPELNDVRQRLAAVAQGLEQGELSPDAEVAIQNSLNALQQQAAQLASLSNPPPVDALGIDEAISSVVESIEADEQAALQEARNQADQAIRQKKEPAIRDMRLALRDQQDQATELRRQIAQMQREQADFQAKAARAEALRREMSDVKQYLSPFTAPGHLQPKSDRNAWDTERTADAKPVSLARLKRLGALEPTMEGLERLYIFGGGKNAVLNNSRPLGSFPEYWAQHLSKPDVLQAVKRAQQLLRDHGQALVEAQLLSP